MKPRTREIDILDRAGPVHPSTPVKSEVHVKLKTARDHTKDPPKPSTKAAQLRQCPRFDCGAIVAEGDDDWDVVCPLCGTTLIGKVDGVRHARALRRRPPSEDAG